MPSAPPEHPGLRCLIIIPAFNERQSVPKLVHRLRRALPTYDVLVIDDGSTDDTLRQVPPDVAVVSLPFNLGIGGAMQTGYRYAALNGYDIAVQVDGDGQHRPGEVWRLVEHLIHTRSDLVVGSRFLGDGRYRHSITRLVGIHILDFLIRALSGIPITDCTSGFRVANRRVIRAFAHWYPEDYPEPEVILLLHRGGYKISEVGVKMRQRRAGMTSIPLTRGLFYVLKVTTALLLDVARDPWPRGKVLTDEPQQGRPTGADLPAGFVISDECIDASQSHVAAVRQTGDSQPDPGRVRWQPAPAGGATAPPVQA